MGLLTACGLEVDEPIIEEPTLACAQSCNGCCSGESCIADGSQLNACGSKGVKCAVCKGTTSCRENAAKEMNCVLDSDALWQVRAVSAQVTNQTSTGFDWDPGGSPPDVIAELVCPPLTAPTVIKTSEVESFTPQWTGLPCTTTSDALFKEPISIKLIDVDFDFNDDIASASYRVAQQDFEAGQIVIPLSDQKSTVTLQLIRKQ
jgi:hypothetical protein